MQNSELFGLRGWQTGNPRRLQLNIILYKNEINTKFSTGGAIVKLFSIT